MRIMVLGGAGYIGSHTVYELIDAGYEDCREAALEDLQKLLLKEKIFMI